MILITGATGNVGRPLIDLLVSRGAKVRAVTRNPQPDLPGTVEIDNSDTPSLDGVTSVFLNPRAVGMSVNSLVARARAQGVRRLVALSAINADDPLGAQPSRYRGDLNKEVETAAVNSGLEWVSLRPTMFCSNAIGMWAAQIRHGDVVRGAYPSAAWAPVHDHDLAGVATYALLYDDLLGQKIELTGPRSPTQQEMVAAIGHAIGRNLTFGEMPPEAVIQQYVAAGQPRGFAEALMRLQAGYARNPVQDTGEIERILARPALTFTEWATDNKEAFLP